MVKESGRHPGEVGSPHSRKVTSATMLLLFNNFTTISHFSIIHDQKPLFNIFALSTSLTSSSLTSPSLTSLTSPFYQLKDEVCSPGGVTINAIYSLEKAGVRAAMMDAVDACIARNYELAKLIDMDNVK